MKNYNKNFSEDLKEIIIYSFKDNDIEIWYRLFDIKQYRGASLWLERMNHFCVTRNWSKDYYHSGQTYSTIGNQNFNY